MGDISLFASSIPVLGTAGLLIGLLALWWGSLYPTFPLVLLAISLVVGQVMRLPLPGQGGGLLLSDAAAALVVLTSGIRNWRELTHKKYILSVTCLIGVVTLWSLYTLMLHDSLMSNSEVGVAIAYLVRLVVYLLLIPALLAEYRQHNWRQKIYQTLSWGAASVAVVGIAQYILVPSLSFLTRFGWDPHINRLVSTWLDPNFVGLFFLMVSPLLVHQAFTKKSWLAIPQFILVAVAFLLTQSRSSYIAAVAAVLCLTPFIMMKVVSRWQKTASFVFISSAAITALVVMCLAVTLFPDRFIGLVTHDATVNLRQESLIAAWQQLVEPHYVTGVGYNAYQFAARQEGLITDFTIHSRGGADNSLLTIWVTTGLIGTTALGLLITGLLLPLYQALSLKQGGLAIVGLFSLLALAIHSQFVNSALYGHLLITLALLLTYAMLSSRAHTLETI